MSTPAIGGASSTYTPPPTEPSARPEAAQPPKVDDTYKANKTTENPEAQQASKPPPTVNLNGQTVGGSVNIKA